ncbi:hypothetical protein GJ744_010948 [Endocarpon pusillum]|uniref:Uncharacterized protein n=1 Tax=Endocarpon pusillum TaxID=364733 RepID=A0A8H7ADI9_9EURO|nr:hypothetical protein GJ744_010948 [Endocarpon pusillum]
MSTLFALACPEIGMLPPVDRFLFGDWLALQSVKLQYLSLYMHDVLFARRYVQPDGQFISNPPKRPVATGESAGEEEGTHEPAYRRRRVLIYRNPDANHPALPSEILDSFRTLQESNYGKSAKVTGSTRPMSAKIPYGGSTPLSAIDPRLLISEENLEQMSIDEDQLRRQLATGSLGDVRLPASSVATPRSRAPSVPGSSFTPINASSAPSNAPLIAPMTPLNAPTTWTSSFYDTGLRSRVPSMPGGQQSQPTTPIRKNSDV